MKIPEAIALRNRREIGKAIRPLMRKVRSRVRWEIDEAATVLQIVENQIWSPVLQAGSERWLELAIVVERTNVFEVWRDSIAEFQHLMERHGAFRDVRTWLLQVRSDGKPELLLQTAAGLKGKARSPKELGDAGGRRLILLLSDCTSKAWRSGRIPEILKLWSRANPVTILQLLPEQYWDRSALRSGTLVALRAQVAGPLSRDWSVEGVTSLRRRQRVQQGLRIPIATIRPDALRPWAKALAAAGDALTTGVVLKKFKPDERDSQTPSAPISAEQLVRQFRGTASAGAQELAERMAVLPVNWSVIRLIQKALAGKEGNDASGTGALHLAEMVLSGLLVAVGSPVAQPIDAKLRPRYDFSDGVRDELLASIPISEARQGGEEIAAQWFEQLPQDIRDRVSADIERRYGEALSYFEAFLVPDLPWGEEAGMDILPFAQVTGQVLRRWGGDYAKLADDLERGTFPQRPIPDVAEPEDETQTFEFTVATLVEVFVIEIETAQIEPTPDPSFTLFEFEVVTLVASGRRKQLTYAEQRTKGQAWQRVEDLGNGIALEMVSIPAGRFTMGAPKTEAASADNERPQHPVTLRTFLMGKYPVTQAQWRRVASLPTVSRKLNPNPSHFEGDDRPVERVSWLDAVEFCDRLSAYTGQSYRLPSEAEWEYACRAGTETPFHFGATVTPDLANYNAEYSYANGPKGRYRQETTPVGSFGTANTFGLSDMHGNVWEWCEDHWHGSYEGAPTDGSAWLNNQDRQNSGTGRLLRGGSWLSYPWDCRSACRPYYYAGVEVSDAFGFRVVCSPARTP